VRDRDRQGKGRRKVTTPAEDGQQMAAAFSATHSATDQLQLKAFPLGYNVMNTVKMEMGTGSSPVVVFHLRRID
jgi:hypothetical protein